LRCDGWASIKKYYECGVVTAIQRDEHFQMEIEMRQHTAAGQRRFPQASLNRRNSKISNLSGTMSENFAAVLNMATDTAKTSNLKSAG
jgi:hypothetical protein